MSTTTTAALDPAVETPFTTGALKGNGEFWRDYINSRPSPSEEWFQLIQDYHHSKGKNTTNLAHDVGTGPGNIAERLLRYYDHAVGSDVNKKAMDAAPELIEESLVKRMTFVHAGAEELANSGVVPEAVGVGKTDLITVSECIPLLDVEPSRNAFHSLLRPGGTLAIYFYGRPIFAGGPDAEHLNTLYDRAATRICQFLLPFKGTPSFPFRLRSSEAMGSFLDNIALPSTEWSDVVRYKWNTDVPLFFNSIDIYDFTPEVVDRREEGETTKEIHDRTFWQDEWDIKRVKGYLDSVFVGWRDKAGDKAPEAEKKIDELEQAMGGQKIKVTFPLVLLLAKKK